MADGRAQKFSFSETELDGLEAAIQLVILSDARMRHATGDADGARKRFYYLAQRSQANTLRESTEIWLEPDSKRVDKDNTEAFLRARIVSGFADSMPLQVLLATIEAQTTQPYAAYGEDSAKLEIDEAARGDVTNTLLATTKDGSGWCNDQTVPVLRASLAAAGDAYSTFWATFAKVVVGGGLAILLGIFAGPVVGGLVGTYVLGLGGAAAVSAGLALLGGGALAAGGFGMVGGTVVIAAAFGAAGAGATSMFAGEKGDLAARMAAIKHLAGFRALLDLDLLDHQLADDFIVAMETQKKQYAATKGSEKVGEVFRIAEEWLRQQYGAATQARRVHRQPRAWREPVLHHVEGIGDLDFRALVVALNERRRALENCLAFLRNAHRRYADVKDADFMKGLWGSLSGASRRQLLAGHGHLQDAITEIAEMLMRHQDESARLARALQKAEVLGAQLAEKDELIARYEKLTGKLHEVIAELRGRNATLRAALESAEERSSRALAAVSVLLGLYRAAAGPRRLGKGEGLSATDEAERNRLVLDLQLLLLLGERGADLRDSVERAAKIGVSIPTEEEVHATIEALGLPLGTPMTDVNAAYKERAAEVHPDRHVRASSSVRKLMEQQFSRVGRAVALHVRYAEMMVGGAS